MTYVDIIFIIGAIILLWYIAKTLTTNPNKKSSNGECLIDSVYIPVEMRKSKK